MLKGIHGNKMGSKSGKRMFIVRSPEEFLRVYDAHETPGTPNLMIQEFIPGDHESDWMFNGYANSAGQCLMGITGVKLRQYPAYTGLTSLGICLQNAEVQRWAATFMERTGYSGILDMDFRYDARDGEYKLLDANPRVGATFRLFVGENGMDVVRAQYLDLTGQAVPAVKSREGRKWMVEDCDLLSCLRYFRDGKLTASDWLKSHRGIQETAIFALDDPLPALWMGLRDVWTFWRRRMGGPKAEML
jgi:predicted ATP-grasp superfamily ATP-dependent carboligase